MSDKQFLTLPESPTSFEELIEDNGYFVDKTEFIKTVFTDSAKVLLFTRPRRFGKTLLMTMFESFLKIDPQVFLQQWRYSNQDGNRSEQCK